MEYHGAASSILRVSSLKQFRLHEAEIVKRIAATPHGGRLLLIDPRRLLRDIGVELTDTGAEESRGPHPELFAPTGREHAYDMIAKSAPGGDIEVTIDGLFAKGAK